MMRISRFKDRASYKPSEVLGLFIISLFGGMFVFLLCLLLNQLVDHLLGYH